MSREIERIREGITMIVAEARELFALLLLAGDQSTRSTKTEGVTTVWAIGRFEFTEVERTPDDVEIKITASGNTVLYAAPKPAGGGFPSLELNGDRFDILREAVKVAMDNEKIDFE